MAVELILSCKALQKVAVKDARRFQHTQHRNALLRLWSSADSAQGNETDLLTSHKMCILHRLGTTIECIVEGSLWNV